MQDKQLHLKWTNKKQCPSKVIKNGQRKYGSIKWWNSSKKKIINEQGKYSQNLILLIIYF